MLNLVAVAFCLGAAIYAFYVAVVAHFPWNFLLCLLGKSVRKSCLVIVNG